jgi:hypothetical protein
VKYFHRYLLINTSEAPTLTNLVGKTENEKMMPNSFEYIDLSSQSEITSYINGYSLLFQNQQFIVKFNHTKRFRVQFGISPDNTSYHNPKVIGSNPRRLANPQKNSLEWMRKWYCYL